MLQKNALLFKVLLNRFNPGASQAALKCLPKEEAQEILSQPTTSQDVEAGLNWASSLLSRTHYSWLAPLIQTLPQALQSSTVAALPMAQGTKLQQFLKLSPPQHPLAESVKAMLLNSLFARWQPNEAIPIPYLAPSKLSPLLEFSKGELVELIDFLALHDLSEALRHIVDKKLLKNIYECLTNQQQQYLRICLHNKEKIVAPKLELQKWDGNPATFHDILHKRGLLRLGKTLCGQSAYFMWHISHTLDVGRGKSLLHYYQDKEIPSITPILIQQLLSLINFLKPKSGS